jgi:uncharacterized protein YjbI with pentapeptide repeats
MNDLNPKNLLESSQPAQWNHFRRSGGIVPDLAGIQLSGARLSYVYSIPETMQSMHLPSFEVLFGADLSYANLTGANLSHADLRRVDLSGANLRGASLQGSDLAEAKLDGAQLQRADLGGATLLRTSVEKAVFTGCCVYGASVWDLRGEAADQSNLIITPTAAHQLLSPREYESVPAITVDNLEVAQFIYLLLNNAKVRQVIDAVTSKVVLILGRFSEERKRVLDAIRDELRRRDLSPVLFDFAKPISKDVTGTVETLARMARFIVADLTEPSSIPHELATIVPFLRTTPVLPLRLVGSGGYSMFADLQRSYTWVLSTYEYVDGDSLVANLPALIGPANAMAEALRMSGLPNQPIQPTGSAGG